MIAKSYYGWNSDFTNVIKADEYIKSVIPNAEYMDITKDNAVAFVPKTNGNFVYEIDGKLYNTIWTNSYKELIEFYKRRKHDQTTIFDFLEE